MKKVSFLIAADSYIIRKGIVYILRNIQGAEVMLDTGNPDVLKNQLKERMPDYLIIDSMLKEKNPDLSAEFKGLNDITILILDAKDARKNDSILTLLLQDQKTDLVSFFENLVKPFTDKPNHSYTGILSEREITVLQYVARGLTNKQIADKLYLSLHTVTTHRKNIGNKLGIKSASGLTVYAIVNNLISIEEITPDSAR